MLKTQHRLRFPIPLLLSDIGLHRETTVMPDQCTWTKSNPMSRLQKAPTHVYIISRRAKLRIKSADLAQNRPPVGHVTPGNMLRLRVAQQNMGRCSWAGRHRCRHGVFRRRVRVGSPHRRISPWQKSRHQKVEPICIRHTVGIGVRNNLPCRRLQSHIPSSRKPTIRLQDVFHHRKVSRDRLRIILRSVIDQDHLIIGVTEFL